MAALGTVAAVTRWRSDTVRDFKGKVALVTGAGGGIGRETALALAREGAILVVCDVREDTLRAVQREIADVSECLLAECVDVSDYDAMRSFADRVHDRIPAVDLLVNNAGVGMVGTILNTPIDGWRWIVGINLWGVIHGCRAFLPNMVKRGKGGHVVNVSSMVGYTPTVEIAAYATTKFGVLGLSLCMRCDLAAHGIGVTAVCPGIINTDITRTSPIHGHNEAEALRKRVVGFYCKRNYTPARVARGIIKAVRRNRAIAPISPEAWFAYALNRVWPGANRALWSWTVKRIERN